MIELKLPDNFSVIDHHGKSSSIGHQAVEIVEYYFRMLYPNSYSRLHDQEIGGVDLCVILDGEIRKYEIKGTSKDNLSFATLKVSSQDSYDALMAGMEMIRVMNVGNNDVKLQFLKVDRDFELEPEVRFKVKRPTIK